MRNENSRQPPLSYIMKILENVLFMLLENNNVSSVHTQAPVSSKKSTFYFKICTFDTLSNLFLESDMEPAMIGIIRTGNGICDPNGTDSVYVSVGETAKCVKKSQGVHTKCLKKTLFQFQTVIVRHDINSECSTLCLLKCRRFF